MAVGSDLEGELHGSVLMLTLSRPRAANALNAGVRDAFCAALGSAASDKTVDAVVLTGIGDRVFCGGVDLKNPEALPLGQLAEQRATIVADMLAAILDFQKPFVVAVNGAAVGAGVFVALLADSTFVATQSRFQLSEIDVGMPTLVGLAILSDLAGSLLAADMVLTGRAMSAEEAAGRGFATVVASDELIRSAVAKAKSLGAKPAVAMALNKRWINERRREAINLAFESTGAQRKEIVACLESTEQFTAIKKLELKNE